MNKAERASFPPAETCMTCHKSMQAGPFPSAQVYTLPDFVFFSHARHLAAKVACDTCHGAVMEQEKVTKLVTQNMKFCVDCHKSKQAIVTCTACHELSQ